MYALIREVNKTSESHCHHGCVSSLPRLQDSLSSIFCHELRSHCGAMVDYSFGETLQMTMAKITPPQRCMMRILDIDMIKSRVPFGHPQIWEIQIGRCELETHQSCQPKIEDIRIPSFCPCGSLMIHWWFVGAPQTVKRSNLFSSYPANGPSFTEPWLWEACPGFVTLTDSSQSQEARRDSTMFQVGPDTT